MYVVDVPQDCAVPLTTLGVLAGTRTSSRAHLDADGRCELS